MKIRSGTPLAETRLSADGAVWLGRLEQGAGLLALDFHTGKQIGSLNSKGAGTACAVSRDGKRLALACEQDEGQVLLIQQVGATLQTIAPAPDAVPIGCLCFSSDDRWLAAGAADGTIDVWRLADGKLVYRLDEHGAMVMCITHHPKFAQFASLDARGNLQIWRLPP
jgi:WD40 repeat protein